MLFSGRIQFPESVRTLPDLRIYQGGKKISTAEIDAKSKRVFFTIPDERHQTRFTLLITESFQFKTEDNVVHYLKLAHDQPYKFYAITLKERLISTEGINTLTNQPKEPITQYYWDVKEMRLPYEDGRIPDTTIIVCCNPDYIDYLQGGSVVELPTIYIKRNILSLVGSESKLHEKSVELLLASLDYDMMHVSVKQKIKPDYQAKTILAITT